MVRTDGRSFVRCTVTWLPNFLGWVDYLSCGAPLWRVIIANKCTWKVAHGSTTCTVLPADVYPQYLLKWSKHKAHFLRAVHIAKSLRFFYQFQRWVGMKRAELTNFFCQQRWSARFDLHVWSNVLKNFGDSETFFLSKAIARTIALSKSTRFYLEDIIDSTWTNQG